MFAEISGVLHSKLYVFDDNVILTGANLSSNYFTTRLDRYWVFQQHQPFSDFCEDLIDSLGVNCFKVDQTDKQLKRMNQPNERKSNYINQMHHQLKMFKYEHRVKILEGSSLSREEYFSNVDSYNNYNIKSISQETLLDFKINIKNKKLIDDLVNEHQTDKNKKFKDVELLKSVLGQSSDYNSKSNEPSNDNNQINEVYLYPAIQIAPIQIRDDENLLFGILKRIKDNLEVESIKMSTGYFNPPKDLLKILLSLNKKISVITSSPEANSFYKGGFIKRDVPFIYRNILSSFAKKSNNVQALEFKQDNWSFHCKGMWLYKKGEHTPFMTTIGSSNYSNL